VKTENLWDIFCKVIDNFGDIGVCWRLAADLAARGERVRLWVDDPSALLWMAPARHPRIEVRAWQPPIQTQNLEPSQILVEAFGCEIDAEFIAAYAAWVSAAGQNPVWLNLEYLSAEAFVARSHGLPSPVMRGPGAGLSKHFFYPGFTVKTGGLLREPALSERLARFDRTQWLAAQGLVVGTAQLMSLFCYEPPALDALLQQLANLEKPTRLLVTAGRATQAVQAIIKHKNEVKPLWNNLGQLSFSYLPLLGHEDFDHLLWACDLNFVRGEDSLVRAIWANKPFVWQIYPQEDGAHAAKLEAFLALLPLSESWRAFHRVWNGLRPAPLPALDLAHWQAGATQLKASQTKQIDLVTQLMGFVNKTH
jgi:uncharacterized repeat protein (TIGR03837 family)